MYAIWVLLPSPLVWKRALSDFRVRWLLYKKIIQIYTHICIHIYKIWVLWPPPATHTTTHIVTHTAAHLGWSESEDDVLRNTHCNTHRNTHCNKHYRTLREQRCYPPPCQITSVHIELCECAWIFTYIYICIMYIYMNVCMFIYMYVYTCVYICIYICTHMHIASGTMGWLRLVGSLKLLDSFAEYRLFCRALLH